MKKVLVIISTLFIIIATIGFGYISLPNNDLKVKKNNIEKASFTWQLCFNKIQEYQNVFNKINLMVIQLNIMGELKFDSSKRKKLLNLIECDYKRSIAGLYAIAYRIPSLEDSQEWRNLSYEELYTIYLKYYNKAIEQLNGYIDKKNENKKMIEFVESKNLFLHKVFLFFNSFGLVLGLISTVLKDEKR